MFVLVDLSEFSYLKSSFASDNESINCQLHCRKTDTLNAISLAQKSMLVLALGQGKMQPFPFAFISSKLT